MLSRLALLRQSCERAAAGFGLVPRSVVAGGHGAASCYMSTVRTGESEPCHVRVHVLGHERVGKTSLYRNLTSQTFRDNEPRTKGAVICDVETHTVGENWEVLKKFHSNFRRVTVAQVAHQLRSSNFHDIASLLAVLIAVVIISATLGVMIPTPSLLIIGLLLFCGLLGWGMALAVGIGIWLSLVLCEVFVVCSIDYVLASPLLFEPLTVGLFAIEFMGCITGTVLGANFALGILATTTFFGLSPGFLVHTGCFESKGVSYVETMIVFVGGCFGIVITVLLSAANVVQLVLLPLIVAGCLTVLSYTVVSSYYPMLRSLGIWFLGGVIFGNGLRSCLSPGRFLSKLFAKLMGTWKKAQYMRTRFAALLVGMILGLLVVYLVKTAVNNFCPKFQGPEHALGRIIEPSLFIGVNLGHWMRNEPIASRPDVEVPVNLIADEMSSGKAEKSLAPLLKVIDFAGQRAYYAMHHVFLSSHGIFIVVFDFRKAFSNFDQHMGKVHFWLSSVLALGTGETARIFLVGTHRDDPSLNSFRRRTIVYQMYKKFVNFLPHICYNKDEQDYQLSLVFQIENSAASDDHATSTLRRLIIEEIHQKQKALQKNPVRWLKVEEEIVQLRRELKYSIVPRQQLQDKVQRKCNLTDLNDFDQALCYLNESGVVFYPKSTSLQNHVIIDPQTLVDALVALLSLSIPPPQNRGTLFSAWSRLETEGIASEQLLQHAWRNFQDPVAILIQFLEYYGIIYNISSNGTQKEYAVISCLPSRLPSGVWDEPTHEDVCKRESRSIYVRFHDISDPHQAFFYVLLTKARQASEPARKHGFQVHWSRTGGVFAFYFGKQNKDNFVGRPVVHYKLENCHGMFKLTMQKSPIRTNGGVLRRFWQILEDIRCQFFPSAEFHIGPACPHCSITNSQSESQSILLARQWGQSNTERNVIHVLPLATSGQTVNRNELCIFGHETHEDPQEQFTRPPTLYCNTHEVSTDHTIIQTWLQISQTRPSVKRQICQLRNVMDSPPSHALGEEIVEDEVLQLIADEVRSREWRRLARCLSLTERQIDEIDYQRGQRDLKGCCRDMMALWKRQCGPDAVGFILAKALHKADLRQLAERYIQV